MINNQNGKKGYLYWKNWLRKFVVNVYTEYNQNWIFASDCYLQIGYLQIIGYLAQNWLFTLFGMDT